MESDFKYPLVLALLIYLGAVRIAIRQRLGALSVDMKKAPDHAGWFALWTLAQRKSRALVLLIPADVMFVGVAAALLYKFAGWPDGGLLTNVIDYGISLGAGYLLLLHVLEWFIGYRPATREHAPQPPGGEVARDDRPKGFKHGRFNARPLYWAVGLIPLLALLGLWAWPIWGPQLRAWAASTQAYGASTDGGEPSLDRGGPSTQGSGSPADGSGPSTQGSGSPADGGGPSMDGSGRSMDRGGPSLDGGE